jgi:hypothetical protein
MSFCLLQIPQLLRITYITYLRPPSPLREDLLQNIGAAAVRFTPAELAELNAAVAASTIRGERLPDFVQVFSDVEAPPRR